MPRGFPNIDTYVLDEALALSPKKRKKVIDFLIGKRISWHGKAVGTIVRLKDKQVAIKIMMDCFNCGKDVGHFLLCSGLHFGAFCYIRDENGKYIANLRDRVALCEKCYETR